MQANAAEKLTKRGSKTGSDGGSAEARPHPLLRDPSAGMSPKTLLTGFYGSRGERIRHVAHVGALRMPKAALDIITENGTLDSKYQGSKPIKLPGLDFVARPSIDPNLKSMIVTDLSALFVPRDQLFPASTKTIAKNRVVNFAKTERIRGGGEDEGTQDVEMTDAQAPHVPVPPDGPPQDPVVQNPPLLSEPSTDVSVNKNPESLPAVLATQDAAVRPPSKPNVSKVLAEETKTSLAEVIAPGPVPTDSTSAVALEEAGAPASAPKVEASTPASTTETKSTSAPSSSVPESTTTSAPASVPEAKTTCAPASVPEKAIASASAPEAAASAPASVPEKSSASALGADAAASAPASVPGAKTSAPTSASEAKTSAPVSAPEAEKSASTSVAPGAETSAPASASQVETSNPALTVVSGTVNVTPKPEAKVAPVTTSEQVTHKMRAAPNSSDGDSLAAQRPAVAVAVAPSSSPAPKPAIPTSKPVAPSTAKDDGSATIASTPVPAQGVSPNVAPTIPPPKPQVVPLPTKPKPQWEQHQPGPNDETQVDPATRIEKPDWYVPTEVSVLERSLLPEWFDESAAHRTEATYIQTREKMISMSEALGNRFLTTTMVRRSILGDIGSLIRLHSFLNVHALINENSLNDSAPTPLSMQAPNNKKKRKHWTPSQKDRLMETVVSQANKRSKADDPINWTAVAEIVGGGSTAAECETQFLALPVEETGGSGSGSTSTTPQTTSSTMGNGTAASMNSHRTGSSTGESTEEIQVHYASMKVIEDLLEQTDPSVVSAVTDAAMKSSQNVLAAKKAAVIGLVASKAVVEAQVQTDMVARVLSEVVDARMRKLENRLSLLDDVEGILEAERVALELERRDLYTARCRHWFGAN